MNYKKIPIVLLISLLIIPYISKAQGLSNKGEIYVGKSAVPGSLYVGGNILHEGDNVVVIQEGNTLLTGDFINNVTTGNVFFNTAQKKGSIIFSGPQTQFIRGSADKGNHYIDFPNIRVNNSNAVRVLSSMGLNVDTLDLVRGRLVLLSDSTDLRKSALAHLLVKGDVHYNRLAFPRENKGLVEVGLHLANNFLGEELLGNHRGLLVGFSPPFKHIYADYFLFNFLSRPSPTGIFGDNGSLIIDPSTVMKAGEGYILGLDIISDPNYYLQNVETNKPWSNADFNERATRQYTFARDFLPLSFRFFTDPQFFESEELNISDVSVDLTKQGFNYVGNPFTCPIDMSTFVQETASPDEWGVSRSTDPLSTADMRSSFYVMSGGTGEYVPTNPPNSKFIFRTSFLLGQAVGSTVEGNIIPPMQMFVVGKNFNSPNTFKIPASARTHTVTHFLRSAPAIEDEILLESVDQDSKAFDRLCVVFRDNASLSGNDKYDASKLFNNSGGISQIYTKTAENRNMTTNVISPQTQSLDLYLNPSVEAKTVTLNARRLESLHSISYLYLEDKKNGQITDLMSDPFYTFTTEPGDSNARFILHFTPQSATSIDDLSQSHLNAYYANGLIHVRDLTSEDKGSWLTVSNIQGVNLVRVQIGQSPALDVPAELAHGVYIIQISGKNNLTTKIVTK